MDPPEMIERLQAKGATDASLQLYFEGDQKEPEAKELVTVKHPEPQEGERRPRRAGDGQRDKESAVKEVGKKEVQISMTHNEFAAQEPSSSSSDGAGDDSDQMMTMRIRAAS